MNVPHCTLEDGYGEKMTAPDEWAKLIISGFRSKGHET